MECCGQEDMSRLLLALLLVLVSVPVQVQTQVRHPVPVLWMMPVSSESGGQNLTASVVPAVHLALQDLKRQPAPLGLYEIQFQLVDSQCKTAESLKALFDAMWAGPRYLLLFGGVCPPVTALIARSLPALNLLQVSFAASSPSLSNRRWYGNLFSTVPSDRTLNQAMVKLLQRFKWTRVGLISQEGARHLEMKRDLMRQLLKADVQLVSTESLHGDVCSSLRSLKDSHVRIIIGLFEEDSASDIFCCAYRLNLFGARYQWLVLDGGAAGWRLDQPVSGCRADSLQTAADGSIRLAVRTLTSNTAGVSGRTPQDYQDSYLRQLTQDGSKVSALHSFAYDAVWVAARALSQAMEALKHREKYVRQRNASEEEVQRTLLEAVRRTQFEGVTGPVFFRNGERMAWIDLIQFQGSSGVTVGDFSSSTQQLRLIGHLLRFPGPGPATDQVVVQQQQQVSLLLYGVMSSAAGVTLFITLVLLFITITLKRGPGRGSGWQDLLLLLGLLLCSSSVLVSGLPGASLSGWSELLCSVQLWTLSLGHSVGFAVIFSRTWRLYSPCSSSLTQRTGGLVLWMVLLDVMVLTSWQILNPLRWVELQQEPQSVSDQDVLVRLYSESCSSSSRESWIAAVCGFKAAQLTLACWVAWSIRSVQVDPPAVGGKHLMLTVFAVTVFSVSGVSGSLLTSHNPPLQLCVTTVLVLCCDIITLSLQFGPKLFFLWSNSVELQEASQLQNEDEDRKDRRRLSSINQQLKSQAAQLDAELESLTLQLSAGLEQFEETPGGRDQGEVTPVSWTHADQDQKPSSPDAVNSPEQMRRRLSIQLPILHHSYLLGVGGVSASSSSLFGSRDAFIHSDDNFLFT